MGLGTLDLVDIDLLLVGAFAVLVELDVVLETLVTVGIGLVDLGVLGQLAVGLEGAGLIGGVLQDDVALLILVVAQGEEDDVALVDPDLLAQLASDVCQSLLAVEAHGLETAVAQHLDDLRVFLTLLLEDQFALLVVVLVLAATAILTTLLGLVSLLFFVERLRGVVWSRETASRTSSHPAAHTARERPG